MKKIGKPYEILALVSAILMAASLNGKTMNGFKIAEPLIPEKEIRRGGPDRDGIMAWNYPEFSASSEAVYLKDNDRVLGIKHNGHSKAYPIKILNRHELVNDLIGNSPVVVSFCPLCASGMTFTSPPHKGSYLNFGVSGLLYNSDVLLFDRQSESLWSQIMMKAINGPLKGQELSLIPTTNTSWGEWKRRHPKTSVIKMSKSDWQNYRIDPYADYHTQSGTMFPVTHSDRRYHKKSLVIGIHRNGTSKAYPFIELAHTKLPLADSFAGQDLLVHYERDSHTATITDTSGADLGGVSMYWFAWYTFHPETEIFQSAKTPANLRKSRKLPK